MDALIKAPQLADGALELRLPLLRNALPVDAQKSRDATPGGFPLEDVAPSSSSSNEVAVDNATKVIAPAERPSEPVVAVKPSSSDVNNVLLAQQLRMKEAEAKAVAEGFAKGFEEGRQKGEAHYLSATRTLESIVAKAANALPGVIEEAEGIIAAIVFEAVCKLLGTQLLTQEGCLAVVQQVVSRAAHDEVLSVLVSPKDFEQIFAYPMEDDNDSLRTSLLKIPFEADERVELGGCLLNFRGGSIDGRIETQFRAFAQSLKDAAKGK